MRILTLVPQIAKLGWIKKVPLLNKKDIPAKNLPIVVSKSISDNFKGYRIDDVDWFEVDKQVFYRVELKKQKLEKDVVLDKNGKIVNKIL